MKIFSTKTQGITTAAAIIAAAGLISRLLGVVRDRVLAGAFGAGDVLDAYYAAFQVPDFIFNLLILGALSAGFIPIFVSLMRNEDSKRYSENAEAWKFTNNVMNIFGGALIVMGAVFFVVAPYLLEKILPGFGPEKLAMTVEFARIMFLSPFFLGLSAIVGGALQSFRRFLFFSLAPAMYNLGIIFGALVLVDYFGPIGLAYGVVIGALLHLLVQLPELLMLGWRYDLEANRRDINFFRMIQLTGPRILTMATNQINLLFIAGLASTLAAGSFAIFNFANNLQSLPLGLFGISFAMAAFPALSAAFTKGDKKEFESIFVSTFNKIVFFILPFSALMILLSGPIVSVVLGTGKFGNLDIENTRSALTYFSFSLFAQALSPLIARAFFARRDTMAPFIISILSVAVNVFASLYFIEHFFLKGLVMGFSLSAVFNFALLLGVLKYKQRDLKFGKVFSTVWKSVLATVLLITVSFVIVVAWEYNEYALTTLNLIILCAICAIAGSVVYLLAARILKINELSVFVSAIRSKLRKSVITEAVQK